MSTQIDQDLKASGIAQVIVMLKATPPTAAAATSRKAGGIPLVAADAKTPELAGLNSYFQSSELSINSAIAAAGMHTKAALESGRKTRTRAVPAPAVLHFPNLGVMLGTVTREGLAGLRRDPRVSKVLPAPQPSLIRPVEIAAAKLTTKTTWGIDFLQVPAVWSRGFTGKGVRVAHLDTGADGQHPALKTAITDFAELDSLGSLVKPSPAPFDSDEHGTHTAATIAGRAFSGKSVGVAPGADLACAIVIEGGNVVARILGGMDWALTQNVRVLSMSLGLRGFQDFFEAVTQTIRDHNILPVFAVGNEGPGTSRSPGNYAEALSVGAVDKKGQVADFSSSQRFARAVDPLVPDVVAPGVDVISAKPGGGVQTMSGSSMATPHIAGLAALLFEAKPQATVDEVERAIFGSCELGTIPPDRGNRGIPNAVRALDLLIGTVAGSPPPGGSKKSKKGSAGKPKKEHHKKAKKK